MGWSKWSGQFLFLQLLILLPVSLESDLLQVAKDSSDHCPTDDKATYTTTTIIREPRAISKDSDDEKFVAELRARIKKELIADFGAAIQSALQHWANMVDYSAASPKQETKKRDVVEEGYCEKPSEKSGHESNNCIKESTPAVVKDNLSVVGKRKRDNGYNDKSRKKNKPSRYIDRGEDDDDDK